MRFDALPLPLAYPLSLAREGFLTPGKLGFLLRAAGRALAHGEWAGPLPMAVVIEPTDACTLSCPGCGYNLAVPKTRAFIARSDFQRVLDQAAPGAVALLLYLAGEPFLHPELPDLVADAAAKKLAVIISTNGNFRPRPGWAEDLVRARCHTLIFSLSGQTQATYGEYHRGGDLAAVQARVREALATRAAAGARLPIVTVRYLVTGSAANRADLEPARRFYRELGVDRFETRAALAQLRRAGDGPDSAPAGEPADAGAAGDHFCFWLWTIPVIKADLRVLPCCYEFYGVPALGSLRDASLAEIWNGPAYRDFRARVRRARPHLACCRQCRSRIGFQDGAFAEARTVRL